MLYLSFIFLSIQIWLMWKDINAEEWKSQSIIDEFFIKKNLIYIFSAAIFFIIHEFLESTAIPEAVIVFEFFEVLALISLLLFISSWHNALKPFVHKKYQFSK